MIVKLLVPEEKLELGQVEAKLLHKSLRLKVLDLGCLVNEEGVEATLRPGFFQSRLLWVQLRIESMNEEHSDEHVLWVETLPLLLLHELLF
jgi:hypothetical protein